MIISVGKSSADGILDSATLPLLRHSKNRLVLPLTLYSVKTKSAFAAREYAKGTLQTRQGLSVIDDGNGKGLIIRKPQKGRHTFLEAGSVVYSAAKTKNLWQWGDISPAGFMSKLTGAALNPTRLRKTMALWRSPRRYHHPGQCGCIYIFQYFIGMLVSALPEIQNQINALNDTEVKVDINADMNGLDEASKKVQEL